MISSHSDYLFFLEADRIALGKSRRHPKVFGDDIWKYQRLLRKLEYYTNCRRSLLFRPALQWLRYRFHRQSIRFGFSIPLNVCGPGLSLAHVGTVVISPSASLGSNCRIHVCVNIGTAYGKNAEAPRIGDNVYIGPGAKLFGKIMIADNIAIGANAVVNRSFEETGITIAGSPARKISEKGSVHGLLQQAGKARKTAKV